MAARRPELLIFVGEGDAVGSRASGGHHGAQHDTAMAMEARVHLLASGINGAARLLPVAAPASSVRRGYAESLREPRGKRVRGKRTATGKR